MLRNYIFGIFMVLSCSVLGQGWTPSQFEKANTAKDIVLLTEMEKEVIMYLNLCRLYPQDFLAIEVSNYFGPAGYGDYLRSSTYRSSLIRTLQTMEPTTTLHFDEEVYYSAQCFAIEHGKKGRVGHDRIRCEENFSAECCSYGMSNARDVVMQLLVDHNVPSLGHRFICLSSGYSEIGVSIKPHLKHGLCAVLDFD